MSEKSSPQPKGLQPLLRIFWNEARPAHRGIALGILVMLSSAVLGLVIPQVLGWLVDGPLQTGEVALVWFSGGLVLALGMLQAIMLWLRRKFVLEPATKVEANLKYNLYSDLVDLPVSFHDRWPSGQLLSRAQSDSSTVRRWLMFGLVLLVTNIITIVVGFVILFVMSWVLGLVMLIFSIPLWFFSYRFEGKYEVFSRRSQDQEGDLATRVEESVHGIRVLKAFGRGEDALKAFTKEAESLRDTEVEKAKTLGWLWFWLILVPSASFGIVLLVGAWVVATDQISLGELVTFFATATALRWPIESIGFLLSLTGDANTASTRIHDVTDAEKTIADPENPVTITDPKGSLEFRDVHFGFKNDDGSTTEVLKGVNLTVNPGETVALVGITGSGKTMVTSLAARFHDPDSGQILLDGVDIRELTQDELHTHIAMAFEEATLFSASVEENVLMGYPEGNKEDLDKALQIAQATFVYSLPDGVETAIGEQGLSLSGGQRQRLALARAVAARPRILVLDDPLSALDVHTEALVENALREVLDGTTALIVAHRPSTVQMADRVALLDGGKIIATGKHSDLLATNARYRFVLSSLEAEEERKEAEDE